MSPPSVRRPLVALLALASLCAAFAVAPGAAADSSGSGGFGVTPTHVDFGGVVRDGVVERTFSLQNAQKTTARVELSGEGALASWVEYPSGVLTIPPETTHTVTVVQRTPTDAANGAYSGRIVATLLPESSSAEDESRVHVQYSIPVTMETRVSGEQVVRIEVGDLFVPAVEERSSLPLSLQVKNTGNVRADPVVVVTVRDINGSRVDETELTAAGVRAGKTENVTVRYTPTLVPGQYGVDVRVLLDGESVAERSATVHVHPFGELRQNGEMRAITTTAVGAAEPYHRLDASQDFVIRAPFHNTGEVDVDAWFEGYIARDGRVVQELHTEPLRVPAGESVVLSVLVTGIDTPGQYTINGKVFYGNKVTDEHTAILTLANEDGAARITIPAPGVLGVLGAAAASGLAWRSLSRRS